MGQGTEAQTDTRKLFTLEGQVALVTGAASGLGREIALGFANVGATVVLADVQADRLTDVAAQLRDRGRTCLSVPLDVRDAGTIAECRDTILSHLGRVDVLVNTAGLTRRHPAEDFPLDDWDLVIAVNLTGTFLMCRAIGQVMLKQGRGSIINFASIGGLVALQNTAAYCASKGGVVQLTRALAIEWGGRGVRVNAIAPCTFDTEMTQQILRREPEFQSVIEAGIPMGRIGRPSEITGAAIFLAAEASSMVNGHILAVDGGYVAR